MTTALTDQSPNALYPIMTLRLLWTFLALSSLHILTTGKAAAAANLLETSTKKQNEPKTANPDPDILRKIESKTNPKIDSKSKRQPITNDNADLTEISDQKLTVIAYASNAQPARHLVTFADRFGLDFHLIGVDRPWGGFNDKITGFSSFIENIENAHNSSIVLVLDAYDTVPICNADEFLAKFNSFGADIVMSTGKDCWPDPNVESFLMERLSVDERQSHPFFPWFLCPNSGAIMGRHDAMLSMFRRVHKLVNLGNGSCSDFEGTVYGVFE